MRTLLCFIFVWVLSVSCADSDQDQNRNTQPNTNSGSDNTDDDDAIDDTGSEQDENNDKGDDSENNNDDAEGTEVEDDNDDDGEKDESESDEENDDNDGDDDDDESGDEDVESDDENEEDENESNEENDDNNDDESDGEEDNEDDDDTGESDDTEEGDDTSDDDTSDDDDEEEESNDTSADGSEGVGRLLGDICLPECLDSSEADDDGDGCGNENDVDCIVPNSELALDTVECDPTTAEPPPEGDGYRMGCVCLPICESEESEGDEPGWGWEKGASCVIDGSDAVEDKARCVPPPPPTGDGYMVEGEDGIKRCVPACEKPEWVEDDDGWGYEHRQTCIVEGSNAESQVQRCELEERSDLLEPGDGYLLEIEDDDGNLVDTCVPACTEEPDLEDEDQANGWGWEQDRTCIYPDSKAAIQGIPCVPPDADVTGSCPSLDCPVVDGNEIQCGCTWVNGHADRKAEIVAAIERAGIKPWDMYFLASAMMETDNLQTDYPLGDNKQGDAFNAGLCKQNLGMIKMCYPSITTESQAQAMNSDLDLDVTVYNACREMFGDNWWSGHRMGANNLGLNTYDIRVFKAAMDWTYEMLQEGDGHFDDDVYFWVDVGAI